MSAVFLSAGHPVGFEAYRRHHPEIEVPENQDVLEAVRSECEGIEIVGTPERVTTDEAVSAIEQQKEELAGLLIFGVPPEALISLGLPITGSGGLLGDCTVDPSNGTAIVAHCEGTLRPWRSAMPDCSTPGHD